MTRLAAKQSPLSIFWAVLGLFVVAGCQAQTPKLLDLDSFPKAQLEIRSAKDTHRFEIWIAETPSQQQQGLMFVRDLPEDRGMLFVAQPPRAFNMWMKNTFIPLDMIFIGADGRITSIAERTTPHSLDIVSSGVAVGAILELKGGEAARRALRPGDRVTWRRTVDPTSGTVVVSPQQSAGRAMTLPRRGRG
jgi:uncharacterized membrane protein (UPF0127 family)